MLVAVSDLLAWALAVGSTSAGAVLAIRALPPVQKAMWRLQKPWACDVCMGFWLTGLCAIALSGWRSQPSLLVAAGPAYPLTLWLLRKLQEPTSEPKLPPLEGD